MTAVERLGAFIEATCTALAELAGVEAIVSPASSTERSDDLSAVIGLHGAAESYLVLTFPCPTATALAECVLVGASDTLDQNLVRDCIGELANVIAGQAKALLGATADHFSFGLPSTVIGPLPATVGGEHCAVNAATFDTRLGTLTLRLIDQK